MCGDSPCPYARSDLRRHFGVSNSRLIEKQESVRKMKSGGHRQVVSKVEAELASSEGVCHLPYGTNTPLIATTMTSPARKKMESILASMRDTESPISILLNSNNTPNDSETILIKECIVAAEETIRGLQGTDSEFLSDASQTLEGTRNQEHLQELTEIIRLHKSLLSSSRLLPNELLIEIFLFFAQPEDLTTYVAPWVLGHICRRWRNISLSMPSLWKYFPPIRIGHSNSSKSANRQRRWVAVLLSRSSGSTISLYLHTSTYSSGLNTLKMIISHSERWEHVSLDIYDLFDFGSIRRRLSSLQSLELRMQKRRMIQCDLFGNAPNLTDITLYPRPRFGTFTLPWHQIQSYKDEMTDLYDIGHLLMAFPSELRTLHFTTDGAFSYAYDPTRDDLGHYALPNLTSLTFESFHRNMCPRGLLDTLTCPNLREVVFLSFSLHDLSLELQNLIQRSACNLQSLVFFGGSSESLFAILQLTPSLTHLTINDPTLTHMEMLTRTSDGPRISWKLIPRLQTLTLIISKAITDFLNLVEIVAARCDPERAQPTALRSLRLRIADDRSFDYTDLLLEPQSLRRQYEIRTLGIQHRAELKRSEYATSSALVTNLANLEVNDLNINLLYVRKDTFSKYR